MTDRIATLQALARRARVETIKELYAAQSGHPGSSLSTMDVLIALYHGGFLKHDPRNPEWEERDYFILSNGHAVPGLYACLALAGYAPLEKLAELRRLGGLEGHAKRGSFPGIEASSGSLGQGLSVGVGIALGLRRTNRSQRVFVMMSDGEQQEGSTWEAVMYAASQRLGNLVAIIDQNGNQINGPTHEIMPILDDLAPKYRAFGWEAIEIQGNDMDQVVAALERATGERRDHPLAIISHTTTGKGVSFMEGDYHWHHGKLSDELFLKAMKDLGEHVSPTKDETWLPGRSAQ